MTLACPGGQPDQSTGVTAVQPHGDASMAQLSVYGWLLLRDSGAVETAHDLDAARSGLRLCRIAPLVPSALAADQFVEQIRIWDRDHRHGPGPRLTVHPADTPDADLPSGLVIDRRHTRIVISWPDHPG